MSAVVIQTVDESPVVPFPTLEGVSAAGAIATRSVIQPGRPLLLWVHELQPGALLRWRQPKVGHLLYVWKGAVRANGAVAAEKSVVVVEHRAHAEVEAGAQGASLLHYHESESTTVLAQKAGGNVHVVGPQGLTDRRDERNSHHTLWADSHCPTCELWFHRSAFVAPRPQGNPHRHDQDEIIFVEEGGTIVGKTHRPGTAIAIDANVIYGFGVAEGGAAFLNFRPRNPAAMLTERRKPKTPWFSEYELFYGKGSNRQQAGGEPGAA